MSASRRLLMIFTFGFVMALGSGCSSDGAGEPTGAVGASTAGATPAASETPMSTPTRGSVRARTPTPAAAPPVVGHPLETRTGDHAVDAIIDAMLAQDANALLALARFEEIPCATEHPLEEGHGPPPLCPDGVSEGTALTVMVNSGCHGILRTPEELHFDLGVVGRESRLYAVAAPPDWAPPDAEHYVLFAVRLDHAVWGYAFVTGRSGFVSIDGGCGSSPGEMLARHAQTPYLLGAPE